MSPSTCSFLSRRASRGDRTIVPARRTPAPAAARYVLRVGVGPAKPVARVLC